MAEIYTDQPVLGLFVKLKKAISAWKPRNQMKCMTYIVVPQNPLHPDALQYIFSVHARSQNCKTHHTIYKEQNNQRFLSL